MKIQFGTPMTTAHVMGTITCSCVCFTLCSLNSYLQFTFGHSENAILHSRRLNVTHVPTLFCCHLRYDDCLCPVLSNKTHTSEKCITSDDLAPRRIYSLISFLLQIFLVWEFFSLSGNYRCVIICTLWIVAIFTFIGMTISIYWNSCYHPYILPPLLFTGGLLFFLSFHNMVVGSDRARSISNRNQVIVPHRSETTNNESRSWLDVL
jgi:hypothetical protein